MKKYFAFLFFVLIGLKIAAQGESFGLNTSNYAGVNSIVLNPSAMHNQNVWLSFNGISGDLFLNTDFIYLNKNDFQLSGLIGELINYLKGDTLNFDLPMHITDGFEERPFYSFDSKRNTSFNQSMRLLGPSVMLSYNQHSIAITSAARMQSNVRNITPELGNLITYGFPYFEPYANLNNFQVDDFSITSMAWTEIGLSYSYRLDNYTYNGWSFGMSIKRLFGAGGGYLDVNQGIYSIIGANDIDVSNQEAEIGFSFPIDYDKNDFIRNNILKGRGWSFDIGFTYLSLLKSRTKSFANRFCEQPLVEYKYRIGVALLDIGSISYKNGQTHNFNTYPGGNGKGDFGNAQFDNINETFQTLSQYFYQDSTMSLIENSMRIALPMALSVQFDYNMEVAHLYWNAALIYGVPLQGGALRRPSQLTIAPRYETRNIEFGLPLSLYQFQYPHLGIYARVGPFTIGSDWFSSLLGTHDFNGMDLYFGVKFQFAKQNCRKKMTIQNACRH